MILLAIGIYSWKQGKQEKEEEEKTKSQKQEDDYKNILLKEYGLPIDNNIIPY